MTTKKQDLPKAHRVSPQGHESNLLDELASNPQLLQAVLSPPIAFNPMFVDIAGSVTAGLLLSVLVDWPQSEDWCASDMDKVLAQTRMSSGELRGARQRLREANLLHERRVGFPAVHQFKLDFDKLKADIMQVARREASAQEAARGTAASVSVLH